MLHTLPVRQKQVIAAGPPRQVDGLADFNSAGRSDNEKPAIAPGRHPVWREPVNMDRPRGFAGGQVNIAAVLKLRPIGIGVIADTGRKDARFIGTGKEQELLTLMRSNVGENATIFGAAEKPV